MKDALIFVSFFLVAAQVGAQDLGKEPGLSCSSRCSGWSVPRFVQFNQIDKRDQTNQIDRRHLGNLSANPFNPDSTANPFGKGSPFAPNGINNPYSPYGSPFSNSSAINPFATQAPRLYDQQGNYRGKLSANP